MDKPPARVLIIDGSPDIMLALEEILHEEGFSPSSADFFAMRAAPGTAERTILARDPQVVVVDIAPDYERNFEIARRWQCSEAARGRTFIFTTTNKAALEKLGLDGAIEILGKPFDLQLVVDAVCRALKRAETDGVKTPDVCADQCESQPTGG